MTVAPIYDSESLNLLITVTDRETGQPKNLHGATVKAATKTPGGMVILAGYSLVYGDPANGQVQGFWPAWTFYGKAGLHQIQFVVQDGPLVGTVYNGQVQINCKTEPNPGTPPVPPYLVPEPDTFDTGVWVGPIRPDSAVPVGAVDSVSVISDELPPPGDITAFATTPGKTIVDADSAVWADDEILASWQASRFYPSPGTNAVTLSVQDGIERDTTSFNLSVYCSIFPPQPVDGGTFYLRAQETGKDAAALNMGVSFPEITFDLAATEAGKDRALVWMTALPPELFFTLDADETGKDAAAINMGASWPELLFTLDADETGKDTSSISMGTSWQERIFTLDADETGKDAAAINMGAGFPEVFFTLDADETGKDAAAITMSAQWSELLFTLDADETGKDTSAINMGTVWPELTFTLDADETGEDTAAITMSAVWPERTFTLDADETGKDAANIAMDAVWPELLFTLDADETGKDTSAITMEGAPPGEWTPADIADELVFWIDMHDDSLFTPTTGLVQTITDKLGKAGTWTNAGAGGFQRLMSAETSVIMGSWGAEFDNNGRYSNSGSANSPLYSSMYSTLR